jgi:hypothetical protein
LALQGTLDTFSLPDVLRLLATTSKTGRLRIEGDRGRGSVWLSDGGVVDADADRTSDGTAVDEVVFELLRFGSGSFAFDGNEIHTGGGEAHDVESVLRRANALLSEWSELESVVPSLGHEVTLATDLSADEVTIDADRWRSLVAIGAGRTVGDLAGVLGLTELGVSRAVRDLVDLGVADVAAPGTRLVPAAAPSAPSASPGRGVPPAPPLTPPEGRPALPPRGAPDGVAPVGRTSPVVGEPQRAGWLQGDHTGEVPVTRTERSAEHQGVTANGSTPGQGDETAPLSAPVGPPSEPPAPPQPPAKGGLAARLTRRNRSPEATTGSTPAVSNGAGGRVSDAPTARTNDAGGRNGSTAGLPAGAGRDAAGRSAEDPTAPLPSQRAGRGSTPSPGVPGRGPSGPSGRPSDVGPARPGGTASRPGDAGSPQRRPGPAGPGGASGPGAGAPSPAPRVPGPAAPAPGNAGVTGEVPSPFDGGRLGPSPVGSDTGQIRPVPPSSLPPDLHWAADDTGNGPLTGNGTLTGSGPLTGPINGGPISSPFSGLISLGPGPNRPGPPPAEGEVAPHVAAMSPQARAAVQATVGNTGGSAGGRGSQGEDIAQRGRLISFLSTVR